MMTRGCQIHKTADEFLSMPDLAKKLPISLWVPLFSMWAENKIKIIAVTYTNTVPPSRQAKILNLAQKIFMGLD